ncbi:MAG TPA: glucose 1-dehydrogenase [Candidatus Dormibacteraeota bacterium]|nr:glucose 1-dehydrogenase [Candidatus Dormibacteraeota bacterium]
MAGINGGDLAGRRALVTGSTRGIGLAVAEGLAAQGVRVAVNSRDAAAVAAVASRLGGGAVGVPGDLGSQTGAARVVEEAIEALGGLDILVNNAGMAMPAESVDLSPADWQRTIDLDLSAVFFCSQAAARDMLGRGGGSIVNISSVQAFTPLARRVAYAAAKAGVIGVTRALAAEWAPTVRVNAVAPGYVETAMVQELVAAGRVNPDAVNARTPMRRMARPEEIAAAVVFLASGAASYITGETLMVDGGWTSWAAI